MKIKYKTTSNLLYHAVQNVARQTNLPSFRNRCNNAPLESVCFLYTCPMYGSFSFL